MLLSDYEYITDNSAGCLMWRSDEDGIAGDPVHVDAGASLDVVHVYVAVLGDEVDYVVFGGHLHGHGEVVLCLGREEHVHCLLGEGLVARVRLPHL